MAEEQKQQVPVTVEQDKKRLYIKWDITGEQLKETFSKYGNVTESRVVPTGRIRPFAFVAFESEEAAASALAAMNGQSLTTQPLHIEFASKERRERKPRAPKQPKEGAAAKANGSGSDDAAAAKPKRERKPRARRPRKEKAAGEASPAANAEAPAENAAPAAEAPAASE